MAALTSALGDIVGWIVGVVLMFIPTVITFVKHSSHKGTILKCQIALIVVDIVLAVVLWLLPILGIIGSIWSIVELVLWIYLICCAVTDKAPSLFAMIGIK